MNFICLLGLWAPLVTGVKMELSHNLETWHSTQRLCLQDRGLFETRDFDGNDCHNALVKFDRHFWTDPSDEDQVVFFDANSKDHRLRIPQVFRSETCTIALISLQESLDPNNPNLLPSHALHPFENFKLVGAALRSGRQNLRRTARELYMACARYGHSGVNILAQPLLLSPAHAVGVGLFFWATGSYIDAEITGHPLKPEDVLGQNLGHQAPWPHKEERKIVQDPPDTRPQPFGSHNVELEPLALPHSRMPLAHKAGYSNRLIDDNDMDMNEIRSKRARQDDKPYKPSYRSARPLEFARRPQTRSRTSGGR